jgi:hypothetical protein
MGVNHVESPSMFTLWKLALQDRQAALQQLRYLHEQEGGTFTLLATALLR